MWIFFFCSIPNRLNHPILPFPMHYFATHSWIECRVFNQRCAPILSNVFLVWCVCSSSSNALFFYTSLIRSSAVASSSFLHQIELDNCVVSFRFVFRLQFLRECQCECALNGIIRIELDVIVVSLCVCCVLCAISDVHRLLTINGFIFADEYEHKIRNEWNGAPVQCLPYWHTRADDYLFDKNARVLRIRT